MSAGGIRAGKAYVEIGASLKSLHTGLSQARSMIQNFSSSMQSLGTSMLKLGVGGALPFASAMKTFAPFEQNMARIKSVLKPTEQDFRALSDEAKRIGATTTFTASDAAEAMFLLAQGGFNVREILASAAPAVKLAASNVMTLQQAAGGAMSTLRGMGLDAKETMRVLDVLGRAANSSYTDVNLLASGFAYVAPAAKNAQVSIEDTTAALAVLSDAGIRGERAGTTLRAILADLKKPTPEAEKTLRGMNVALQDSQKNWRPLADIFKDIKKGLANTTTGSYEASAALAKIFDIRSGVGVETLLDNIDKLQDLSAKLRNAGGTIEEMEAIQMDTLTGSVKVLLSTLEGLQISVAEALVKPVRAFADSLNPLVNLLADWARQNRDTVSAMAATTIAVAAGGVALIGLSVILSSAATVLGVFTGGLGMLGSRFLFVVGPLLTFKTALLGIYGLLGYAASGRLLESITTTFSRLISGLTTYGTTLLHMLKSAFSIARDFAPAIMQAIELRDFESLGKLAGMAFRFGWDSVTASIKNLGEQFKADMAANVRDTYSWLGRYTFGSAIRVVAAFGNQMAVDAGGTGEFWERIYNWVEDSYRKEIEASNKVAEERKYRAEKETELAELQAKARYRKELQAIQEELKTQKFLRDTAMKLITGAKQGIAWAQEFWSKMQTKAGSQAGEIAASVSEIIGTFSGDRMAGIGPTKGVAGQMLDVNKKQLDEQKKIAANTARLVPAQFV